jgi:diguanylate cyclase (GGDEF)-like protein
MMIRDMSMPMRDLICTAAALALCGAVLWLDARTSSDITEAYLFPLAFVIIYPVKRDGVTFLVAAAAILGTFAGALLEDAGVSIRAMLFNRGMTLIVIVGIAFLLNRVTASQRQLLHVATTDPLTGIFNRRHFMALLAREQLRADRYGTSFSLLMLDIDHFKRVNDTYGHPIGDEAIKALTGAAAKFLRPTDLLGRFGGEEFVIMLPHADEAGAVLAAERVREAVARVVVPAGNQAVSFTVSIGIAAYLRNSSTDKLIECADQALYAAKAGGRNQVCVGRLAQTAPAPVVLAPA